MSASTTRGWNWRPEFLRNSANATSWLSARRYDRVEVMAS